MKKLAILLLLAACDPEVPESVWAEEPEAEAQLPGPTEEVGEMVADRWWCWCQLTDLQRVDVAQPGAPLVVKVPLVHSHADAVKAVGDSLACGCVPEGE